MSRDLTYIISRADSEITYYASASSHFANEESLECPAMNTMSSEMKHQHGIYYGKKGNEWNGEGLASIEESDRSAHNLNTREYIETASSSSIHNRRTTLAEIQIGQIFANRYLIERSRNSLRENCQCAVDTLTRERVFLEFFPNMQREFENSVKMHRLLSLSPYICKLIEIVVDERGYPPCLVFERGDYTFSERLNTNPPSMIRRLAVLHAILEALEHIHEQGVTHGSLSPWNIMWFSADCTWKLIDLKHASIVDDWTLVRAEDEKYAAPETQYAEQLGQQYIHLDPKADMWSFGVIALETLTGRTFLDSAYVQKCIIGSIRTSNLDADHDRRWLFADRKGRYAGSDEDRFNRFVRKLLCRSPHHRMTATDALGDILFRNVEDAYHLHDNTLVQESESRSALQTDPFFHAVVGAQIRVKATVEAFIQRNQAEEPFHARAGYRAYTEDDEELENETIYIMRFKESFRLRLIISYAEGCQLPIQEIESISLKTVRGEFIPLEQQIVRADSIELEAAVLMDPSFGSLEELLTVCPKFGTVDEKYKKTTLRLKFRIGDHPDSTLIKNCELHFLIVSPGRKLRRYRLVRKIQENWSRLPKPVKQGIRLLGHGTAKAIECFIPF